MNVKIIEYTHNVEELIATAARQCYSAKKGSEIYSSIDRIKAARMINFLIERGHLSPVEHACFTFSIEGISRSCSHQLVRHRLASYSQQSQRYVRLEDKTEYVVPSSIANDPEIKAQYDKLYGQISNLYTMMLEHKIPPEDARYILPNATKTNIIMTMNARELIHASRLRLCSKAQWEIRRVFKGIREEVKQVSSTLASFLEPKCVQDGFCREEESCSYVEKVK